MKENEENGETEHRKKTEETTTKLADENENNRFNMVGFGIWDSKL